MPGRSHSCSRHDRSLCPISAIGVAKYAFLALPAHRPMLSQLPLPLPLVPVGQSRWCSKAHNARLFKLLTVSSHPVLCQTLPHFPPGLWVRMCGLPASPRVSHRLHLLFLMSGVSPSLQDMLHLFPTEETGAEIDPRNTVSAATLEGSRRQTACSGAVASAPSASRCPPCSIARAASCPKGPWAGPPHRSVY